MRWTWLLGLSLLAGAPFACSSGFTAESTGGGGSASTTTGPSGSGGAGAGMPCNDVSDCPSPASQCETYACTKGQCEHDVLAAGPVPNPLTGNCQAEVCDGAGNQTTTPDDTDVFDDGNACTLDKCVNHQPSNPPNVGMPCEGTRVCDENGDCVECLPPPAPNTCSGGRTCVAKHCVNALCSNNAKDTTNGETDVDCGGTLCAPCATGKDCVLGRDCQSGVCGGAVALTCQAPNCDDGVKNGNETDVDCGGPDCAKRCGTNADCADPTDCQSGVCTGGKCAQPACNVGGQGGDGVKNGSETDVDCGGPGCDKCHDGKHCGQDADCQTGHCDLSTPGGGVCDHCTDGIVDFSETDVDCGQSCVSPHVPAGSLCDIGQKCFNDADCQSMKCCDPGGGQPKTCQQGCN
jgi:hypothetical protein